MINQKLYQWKGISQSGAKITGMTEAKDKRHLKTILANKNTVLLAKKCISNKHFYRLIKIKHIDNFLYRFYCLIKANMPITNSLNLLLTTEPKIEMAALIYRIKFEIEKGKLLSQAFSTFPKFFNQTVCALIYSSENSNQLPAMLKKILYQRKKNRAFQQKIKKAMIYPVFVLSTAIIVCTLLLKFVVPSFEKLYETLHTPLPFLTHSLLFLSNQLQQHFLGIFLSGSFSVIFFITNKNHPILKAHARNILTKIPFLKSLIHIYTIHYWSYSLSETINAGLPLLSALSLAEKSIDYLFYQRKFQKISLSLQQGKRFYQALEEIGIFSKDVLGLIQVAEQTGNFNGVLHDIATQYHNQLNDKYEQLNKLIEPLMTLFVALITGTFVIALYLPIFNLGELF
jgi:type IV pilus assembly protein PilC